MLSTFYYTSQENLMFAEQRTQLSIYANDHVKHLKSLHHYFPNRDKYPRSDEYKSAIYDIERIKIFSTLENNHVNFDKEIYRVGSKIHFVKYLNDYYLGATYLFIEIDEDRQWHIDTILRIMGFGTIGLLILAIFGHFFVRLFLKPMKASVDLLDNFIKDTTHELNTPISAILANVEMMDRTKMLEKNIKRIDRINIAAKTISHLYQDLTFLSLGHNRTSNDEWIDIKALIIDRVEYFSVLSNSKHITCNLDLENSKLFIDPVKIARVIDNLISNAIKYNRRKGTIKIVLRENYFSIKDTGIGMKSNEINAIFERYSRFNSTEGGFGIGLNIVKSIADEYNIHIVASSTLGEGTEFKVNFPKGNSNAKNS